MDISVSTHSHPIHTIGVNGPVGYTRAGIEAVVRDRLNNYIGRVNTPELRQEISNEMRGTLQNMYPSNNWEEFDFRISSSGDLELTFNGSSMATQIVNVPYTPYEKEYVADYIETRNNDDEIEDLKDQIQQLKDEINELKMLFMEN